MRVSARIAGRVLGLITVAAVLILHAYYIEIFISERLGSQEWSKRANHLAKWCGRSLSWRTALLIGPLIDPDRHGLTRNSRHPALFNWNEATLLTSGHADENSNWKIEMKLWQKQHCKVVEDTLGLNFDTYDSY